MIVRRGPQQTAVTAALESRWTSYGTSVAADLAGPSGRPSAALKPFMLSVGSTCRVVSIVALSTQAIAATLKGVRSSERERSVGSQFVGRSRS